MPLEKKGTSCRLLGFSDASRLAYAAVVHLQVEIMCGSSVLFIAAKTRVSPLHNHSIPRLELLGALLLSRLLSSVSIALSKELKLGPPSCFTDSKVALFWIKGYEREWRQLHVVENRIREIHQLTPVEQWRHCPGVYNPADLPSRGVDIDELIDNQLWLHGPSWLCDATGMDDLNSRLDESVLKGVYVGAESEGQMQFQEAHYLHASQKSVVDPSMPCKNCSSLTRLLRVTALVFKFVEMLESGSRQTVSPSVQTKDIVDTEHYWIRVTQRYLVQNNKFNEWKVQLGLYIDDSGLWRCRGRLNNSSLSESAKHPIL